MKSIYKPLFFCFIALVMLVSSELKAQEVTGKITVRGKVVDKTDKKAIVGCYVIERDKDMRYINGVATDINGNYAIPITNPENLISFSFIGYETIVQPVNGRTTINIELVSAFIGLGEVVISDEAKVTTSNGTGMVIVPVT